MAEDQIRKELDALKSDIAQLRDDIGNLTEAVKSVASEKIDETKAQTRARAGSALEELEARLEDLLAQGSGAARKAEQQISEHPGTSLITAFGVGFIVAKLLEGGERR